MQSLFNKIEQYTILSDSSREELQSILKAKKYPDGTVLCRLGDIPTKAYFLLKGFAKGYALTEKGNHYNRIIYQPEEFMASLSALIEGKKANLALECLTDCTVIEVVWSQFIELSKINTEINLFYRKVLEENFVKFELSNIQLATMTASERYVELRKRCPNIENEVSQLNIASFIGISPVQLSRIRKKLFST